MSHRNLPKRIKTTRVNRLTKQTTNTKTCHPLASTVRTHFHIVDLDSGENSFVVRVTAVEELPTTPIKPMRPTIAEIVSAQHIVTTAPLGV